jgi:hypothetical protein
LCRKIASFELGSVSATNSLRFFDVAVVSLSHQRGAAINKQQVGLWKRSADSAGKVEHAFLA